MKNVIIIGAGPAGLTAAATKVTEWILVVTDFSQKTKVL